MASRQRLSRHRRLGKASKKNAGKDERVVRARRVDLVAAGVVVVLGDVRGHVRVVGRQHSSVLFLQLRLAQLQLVRGDLRVSNGKEGTCPNHAEGLLVHVLILIRLRRAGQRVPLLRSLFLLHDLLRSALHLKTCPTEAPEAPAHQTRKNARALGEVRSTFNGSSLLEIGDAAPGLRRVRPHCCCVWCG